jgi:hypothetical protein
VGTGVEAGVEAGSEAGGEAGADAGGGIAAGDAGADAAPEAAAPMCTDAATQCPATGTLCIVPICAQGVCSTMKATQGATCSDNQGDICDGLGNCVSSCSDLKLDGTETDVDCGGAYCDKEERTCGLGKNCLNNADCTVSVSGFCGTNHTCVAPSCSDGVQNGDETGVDCGGACAALTKPQLCPVGDGCDTATDCVTGLCTAGHICGYRSNGQQCFMGTPASCQSNYCSPAGNCEPCTSPSDCGGLSCSGGTCG